MPLSIFLATIFVSVISLIGGFLLINKRFALERHTGYLVSFAAGVMLATSFFDLLPEALELGTEATILTTVLIGIVVFFFMERFLLWFHHHDDTHHARPSAWLIIVGDSMHNVIDGIAIATTFLTSPALGVAATLAIAAHEIPQELADFSVLIHGGMPKRRALFFNFLSALTALIGAFIGVAAIGASQAVLPFFLAFSAGMFIYIACSDLIPDLHRDFTKQKGWLQSMPLLLGILISWFLIRQLEG